MLDQNPAITARFVYSRSLDDAAIRCYGAYPPAWVYEAFDAAGWTTPNLPRLSAAILQRYPDSETEEFIPPPGSGMFRDHTPAEGKRNRATARRILRAHGIPLVGQHKLTFAERA